MRATENLAELQRTAQNQIETWRTSQNLIELRETSGTLADPSEKLREARRLFENLTEPYRTGGVLGHPWRPWRNSEPRRNRENLRKTEACLELRREPWRTFANLSEPPPFRVALYSSAMFYEMWFLTTDLI